MKKNLLCLLVAICTQTMSYAQGTIAFSSTHASAVFEACKNENITISYEDLSFVPDRIVFPNKTAATTTVMSGAGATFTSTTGSCPALPTPFVTTVVMSPAAAGMECGNVVVATPADAVSGIVSLMDGSGNYANFMLVVQNPDVHVGAVPPLICSDDVVLLKESPKGGTYSITNNGNPVTPSTNYITQNPSSISASYSVYDAAFVPDGSLVSTTSVTSSSHVATPVQITYSYTPDLVTSTLCPAVTYSVTTEIRSTEINSITYAGISSVDDQQPINIVSSNPTYWATGPSGVTFSYSGTYVDPSSEEFLGATAGAGTSSDIVATIDNGGCVFQHTETVTVGSVANSTLSLCSADGTYTFFRDTINYPYTGVSGFTEEYIMAASSSGGILSPILPGNGNSGFALDLNSFSGTISVTIEYQSIINLGWISFAFTEFAQTYTVAVVNPTSATLSSIPLGVCESGSPIALSSTPAGGTHTLYTVTGPAQGTSSVLATNILNPANIDDPGDNTDTQFMLVYELGSGNCVARDTGFFFLVENIVPDFSGRHSTTGNEYCENEAVDFLTPYPAPGAGIGSGVFSGNGISGPSFNPALAQIGNNIITFTFTSIYGCVSSSQQTYVVNPIPNVVLTTPNANNEYCGNETNVPLTGTPSGGNFYGPTLLGNNIFNPYLAFDSMGVMPGVSGTVQVYYLYSDPATGCSNSDTIDIIINPVSTTTINGLNNQYCIYEDIASVSASSTPNQGTGTFSSANGGGGFIGSIGNIYLYDPDSLGWNIGGVVDTVWYFHENTFGCLDTAIEIVRVDTMPQPDILWPGIPTASTATLPHLHYCVDNATFTLNGSPTPNTTVGIDSFYGPGVSPYISQGSPTQTFSAAAAGTGLKDISYKFTDNNGCSNTVTERIEIRPLPTANFAGLAPQYCEDAADDDLVEPQEVAGQGSGVFSGDGIINAADGILSPQTEFAADGPGFKTVMYTFTDTFGCVGIDSQNYYLNPLPIVNLLGLDSAYCQNTGDIVMQGIPFGVGSNYPQVGVVPSMASIGNGQAEVNTDSLNAGQIYTFRYVYTDANGCTNRDSISTEIFAAPVPVINGLDSQYCEIQDSFLLTGTPTGGTFNGPGLLGTDYFKPYRAGPGTHNISYTAYNTNTATLTGATLVCYETVTEQTTVYPLPVPDIVFPDQNTAYCESDDRDSLIGIITNPLQGALDAYYWYGTGVDVDTALTPIIIIIGGNPVQVFVPTYTYYFSPAMAHAAGGQGVYASTYVAENVYGCVDSLTYNYSVYTNPTPAFATDNEVCEGDGETTLFGSPGGGIFSLNGTVLNPPIYNPNPNYPITIGADKLDTLVYEVTNTGFTACVGRDTQVVLVHPNPQLDYVAIDDSGDTTYRSCIGQDTLSLIPNIWGGEFSGAGVLFGSSEFIPNIAGVGEHEVSYSYTDTATGCSNTFIQTFYTYNTPNIEFAVDGGCGDEVFTFTPDNNILGLTGLFLNQQYDTITFIQWDYGDGITANPNPSLGTVNELDPASHLYATYGVYNVSLFVQNNNYCWGTDTVRIIVSPSVLPTATAPYFQDFEADNGGWFDQLEGSDQASNIWNWTVATGGTINTANNSHNLVWVTHGDEPYGQNENAWVYGPCVDLTELDRPMIKLDYFSDTDLGNDGVVIEYYSQSANAWLPLGNVEKGIDWYNRDVIAGRPGIQDLAPIGWSGELNGWKNGRLRLDDYQNYEHFRFRIAFGAVGVQNRGLEGFAFDNVWIGNRTRNVLLEHFANIEYPSMVPTNDHLYDLVYNTSLVKDVHLVQYHIDVPGFDEFNIINEADPATRTLYYGISQAGRAVIDGKRYGAAAPLSLYLSENDFEYEMLETPKFDIAINDFYVVGNQVYTDVSVEAAQNMPHSEYALQIALVEDSLVYQEAQFFVGNMATLRGFIPSAAGASFVQSWAAGDQAQVTEQWELPAGSFDSTRFELVVFIQDYNTKEVFQVASTRDLTVFPGYYYNGINEVEPEVLEQAQQISNMKLYPNPTSNHFTVEFDLPLSQEYQWRLTDMRGVTVQSGLAPANITQLSVEQLDLPAGMYIFSMHADKFFTQRKVIIRNN